MIIIHWLNFSIFFPVTHRLDLLEYFFHEMIRRFKYVFFIPGNHDLWVTSTRDGLDSINKLEKILALCQRLEVKTTPHKIGTTRPVWIVPLFSWYHESFDTDLSTRGEKITNWNDFIFCKWPKYVLNKEPPTPSSPVGTPEDYFLSLNTPYLHPYDAPVITFSHFLPRPECLPPKEVLWIKFLPKVVGTTKLDAQLRSINSIIHCFGHTHIDCNKIIDGVHYVQLSLKYPKERTLMPGTIDLHEMIIYDENYPDLTMFTILQQHFDHHIKLFSNINKINSTDDISNNIL
jgi:hypothetical protein